MTAQRDGLRLQLLCAGELPFSQTAEVHYSEQWETVILVEKREADQKFVEQCRKITGFNVDDLQIPGASHDLRLARDAVRFAADLGETFARVPTEYLQQGILQNTGNAMNTTIGHLSAFEHFHSNSSQADIDGWANALISHCSELLANRFAPFAALYFMELPFAARAADYRALVSGHYNELDALLEASVGKAEQTQSDIDTILNQAQAKATDESVVSFGKSFQERAKVDRRVSWAWLAATISIGTASLVGAFLLVFAPLYLPWIQVPADLPSAVQNVAAKLVLLGTLGSAAFWASRNYRAKAHQATVNQHRADSLRTFGFFRFAAVDQDVKDAILLETTRAIFSYADTGFLGESEHPSTVREIYDRVRSSSGSS